MKKDEKHMALYRKYRPAQFKDIIGQDHIVGAISGAIKNGKVAHAYLLCGPRGIGKTTIARIIARELGTSDHDVYELDAASNRGIEEAREIRENLSTLPFDSKYKVYILDEVHMLTPQAWNALLKSIEEPPAHVIFILATTEMNKVPDTIISRCQNFIFKKPSDTILADVVTSVAKSEGFDIAEGGAELIALLGDGSFRDTLSTLDKILSSALSKKVSMESIVNATGAPHISLVEDFLTAISSGEIENAFGSIRKAVSQNLDMEVYMKMIISQMRYALILRYAPKMKSKLMNKLSEHDIDFLVNLVSTKSRFISSATLIILLDALSKMRNAFIRELPLELATIEILDKGEKIV